MSELPRLDAYLKSLPNGLDSFPECTAKGSLVKENLRQLPYTKVPGLDPRLAARLEDKELVSAWFPEVEYVACFLVLIDQHRLSDNEAPFVWFRVTEGLMNHALYRFLFGMLSRERVLRGVSHQWGAFHRGTELLTGGNLERLQFELRSPPLLFTPLVQKAYAQVLRAVMLHAKDGTDTTVDVVSLEPGRARFATR